MKVIRSAPVDGGEPLPARDPLSELARRAAAQDRAAARALVVAVGPAMLRAIRTVIGSSDAEDVLQDAVEGLLRALPSFRGACTVLHFACRVAVLSALSWRRQWSFRARLTVDDPDLADGLPGADPSPAERLQAMRRREALGLLLDELSPAQAEVLTLHCGLDFTAPEIAASMGCPLETVRSRLRLAKHALRERIGASQELAEILEVKP